MKVNVRQGGCFSKVYLISWFPDITFPILSGKAGLPELIFWKGCFPEMAGKIINKFSPGAYGLDDWQDPCRVRLIDED